MKKFMKIFGGIFFAVGLLILTVGIFLLVSTNRFLKTAVETTATITYIDSRIDSDGDTNHTVTVEFKVKGEKYGGTLNYYSSSMYVGKKEQIYYDPSNPNNFKAKGSRVLIYITPIIGFVFILIGGGVFASLVRKEKKRKKLLSYNYVIQANIVGINLDTSLSVNGRNPYRLEANYINPNDGKIYSYRSEEFWIDITPILTQMQITTIPVYVNPNNYAEYYVDVSNLKQFIGN